MDVAKTTKRRLGKTKRPIPMHPILKWIRGTGVVSELFGWGVFVLTSWFWPAVTIIYLGVLLIVADLWFEPSLRPHVWWRIGGVALIIASSLAFAFGVIFVSAPVECSGDWIDAQYPDGNCHG